MFISYNDCVTYCFMNLIIFIREKTMNDNVELLDDNNIINILFEDKPNLDQCSK